MTKGYTIQLNDLITKSEIVVQLFNGQRWKIRKNAAIRFTTMLQDGNTYDVEFDEVNTKAIFNQIKLIFDPKGRVIGQRIQKGLPLKTTRVNDIFHVQRPGYPKVPMSIYRMIDEQQDVEYGESMAKYWYSSKNKEYVKK
ncbi:hypothetical protein D932_02472 [Enterococcus casseliflavus 14-MB-W-14]|jgi:hypothetical protein|uniref:hypothetical protein n=1 Tax=Enterococcus casseliflavus TaxID=37734 RepID=UPI000352BFBC|nr:hypothetical protein [Enterococcus casseliflavus]EPH62574.1 hypothetical protein D932_02472 [Enterococcus casseliflavus 14-MB-W-14]